MPGTRCFSFSVIVLNTSGCCLYRYSVTWARFSPSLDRLVDDSLSLSSREVEETPGLALAAPPVMEYFLFDHRLAVLLVYDEQAGDQGRGGAFPELELYLDGAVSPAATYLLEAPATALLGKRDLHVVHERVLEETEDIEHGRLARAVGADENAHAQYRLFTRP